jgi:hypothetical protein
MATEQRLIDANARIEEIKKAYCHNCENYCENYGGVKCRACWVDYAIGLIDDAPTVEAVEVVRCKDCEHWHDETGWCTKHSHFIGCDGMACHPSQSSEWKMFNADDFCSYGERREGE